LLATAPHTLPENFPCLSKKTAQTKGADKIGAIAIKASLYLNSLAEYPVSTFSIHRIEHSFFITP